MPPTTFGIFATNGVSGGSGMNHVEFDLAIVGGGINGASVARDAAGRELRVLLVERDDLAGHASSGSPKIIHGGQRFLPLLELGLARAALAERDNLLRNAPHLIHPYRFVVPQQAGARPRWLMRMESLLLNHVAGDGMLPPSSVVDLAAHPAGPALREGFLHAMEGSDAWTDEARLILASCIDAARRGATILPRTECVSCVREGGSWRLTVQPREGAPYAVSARAVVNAAGPWVPEFLAARSQLRARHELQVVKGCHIVVPRLFDHPYAYVFAAEDKRQLFALPYEEAFTLVGCYETEYVEELGAPGILDEEIAWLCRQVNDAFRRKIGPADVVHAFCGLRGALKAADGDAQLDRMKDYLLSVESDGPPMVSVFGGRATTSRELAERVVDCVQPLLGEVAAAWTEDARLPGGEVPAGDLAAFIQRLVASRPELPPAMLARMARTYGTRIVHIIGGAYAPRPLGPQIAPGLHEAELAYLVAEEWAVDVDDVLWRRTKLGLHYGAAERDAVRLWLEQHQAGAIDTRGSA